MKLKNLRLKDEPLSIYIEADGHVWDLHNAFDFEEVRQNISERSVSLSWQSNHYADIPLSVQSFKIVFSGVDYFEITPRDGEIPDFGEDFCLASLSRISPDDDSRELIAYGVPQRSDVSDERFHLWFSFRGGQHIRVGAETAVFILKSDNRI